MNGAWGMSFEELSMADPAEVERRIDEAMAAKCVVPDEAMAAKCVVPDEAARWEAADKGLDRAFAVMACLVWIVLSVLLLRGL